MKKTFFVVVLTFFCSLFAEDNFQPNTKNPIKKHKLSLLAGGGIAFTSFDYLENKHDVHNATYLVGTNYEFPIVSFLALKTGIFCIPRRAKVSETVTTSSTDYTITEIKVTFFDLDFPLLMNFGFDLGRSKKTRIYADLGARISVALYINNSYNYTSHTLLKIISKNYPSNEVDLFNYGGIVALGTEINNKYIIEAKYDFDLKSRYKIRDDCFIKSVWLILGYRF